MLRPQPLLSLSGVRPLFLPFRGHAAGENAFKRNAARRAGAGGGRGADPLDGKRCGAISHDFKFFFLMSVVGDCDGRPAMLDYHSALVGADAGSSGPLPDR